jgi:hypothetical protein
MLNQSQRHLIRNHTHEYLLYIAQIPSHGAVPEGPCVVRGGGESGERGSRDVGLVPGFAGCGEGGQAVEEKEGAGGDVEAEGGVGLC